MASVSRFRSSALAKRYDFVVLGAGNGGSAAAAALARKHPEASVALLEAGGDCAEWKTVRMPGMYTLSQRLRTAPMFSKLWWRGTSVKQEFLRERALPIFTGRGLGGSSLTSDGAYLRGSELFDYDDWSAGDAWTAEPMNEAFKELRLTNRISIERPSQNAIGSVWNGYFTDACDASDFIGVESLNCNLELSHFAVTGQLTLRGRRMDAFRGHCKERIDMAEEHAPAPPNLHVFTGALATRAMFDEVPTSSPRVKGVEVVDADGGSERATVETARLIVSLGAVHSPAFLQRSGVGPKAVLKSAGVKSVAFNDAIGDNLSSQPQLHYAMRFATQGMFSKSRSLDPTQWDYLRDEWLDYKERGIGIFGSSHEMSALAASRPGVPCPDTRVDFFMTRCNAQPSNPMAADFGPGFTLRTSLVRGPHHPGTVRITSSDPTAFPEVDPELMKSVEDRRRVDESVTWAQGLIHPLSTLISRTKRQAEGHCHPFHHGRVNCCYPVRHIGDPNLRSTHATDSVSVDAAQFGGTCSVGTALSEDLSVRGVEGVWVADASIVPKRIAANMDVMAQMIGFRAGREFITAP